MPIITISSIKNILYIWNYNHPGEKKITNKQFRLITDNIGVSYATYKRYRELMIRHGLMKSKGTKYVILTRNGEEGLVSESEQSKQECTRFLREKREKREEKEYASKHMITSIPKQEKANYQDELDEMSPDEEI